MHGIKKYPKYIGTQGDFDLGQLWKVTAFYQGNKHINSFDLLLPSFALILFGSLYSLSQPGWPLILQWKWLERNYNEPAASSLGPQTLKCSFSGEIEQIGVHFTHNIFGFRGGSFQFDLESLQTGLIIWKILLLSDMVNYFVIEN